MTLEGFFQAQANYDSKIFKKTTTLPRLQEEQSVISFKRNIKNFFWCFIVDL